MCTPAAVSIDNDFTAGQASVTLRTANDEATRWLNLQVYRLQTVSIAIEMRRHSR